MSKLPVKQSAMNDLGVGAGLLLTSAPAIDETTHVIEIHDPIILGVTTGGITFNPNPQFRSRTVDGLASNTAGVHTIDRFEPTVSANFLTEDLNVLLKAVGFGDISGNEIIARHTAVIASDYKNLWFLQQKSDGSSVLIKLKNSICTAGSSIKTTSEGETEIPLTFVGNYTIEDQETPPFEITIIPAPMEPSQPATQSEELTPSEETVGGEE